MIDPVKKLPAISLFFLHLEGGERLEIGAGLPPLARFSGPFQSPKKALALVPCQRCFILIIISNLLDLDK
jgi:hypothetical protein